MDDGGGYLFMHHNPIDIGISASDKIGQTNSRELMDIFTVHKDRIRHLFFDHCHLPLSGTFAGIPFASLRGTNHQGWQDFTGTPMVKQADLGPAYNVVLIDDASCVVHTIDYSYDGEIREFGIGYDDWSREATGQAAE